MNRKSLNRILSAAAALLLAALPVCAGAFLAGCGKPRTVEISREEPELLLEIFSDIDRKNYSAALPKIRRYQALDAVNPFLNELEDLAVSNLCTCKIRSLLDSGSFAGADEVMKDSLTQYDPRTGRVELKRFTGLLRETERLIIELGKPMPAATLKETAQELRRTARNLPDSREITAYAERKIASAGELALLERDRRGVPLYLETLDALRNGETGRAETLAALLSLMLPAGKSDPMFQDLYKTAFSTRGR